MHKSTKAMAYDTLLEDMVVILANVQVSLEVVCGVAVLFVLRQRWYLVVVVMVGVVVVCQVVVDVSANARGKHVDETIIRHGLTRMPASSATSALRNLKPPKWTRRGPYISL